MVYNDIYQIEAVGPLLVLHAWGHIMRNCAWLHFIDNEAAQATLCRGSSSVQEGDIVVSETWSRISSLRLYAWFDRVASSSNPVDKLSRGQFAGPWAEVLEIKLPDSLLHRIAQDLVP